MERATFWRWSNQVNHQARAKSPVLAGRGHRMCKSCVNFQPRFPLRSDLSFSKAWLPTGSVRWVKLAQQAKDRVQWGTVWFYLHWWEILHFTHSLIPVRTPVPPAFCWSCLIWSSYNRVVLILKMPPLPPDFFRLLDAGIPSFTAVYEAQLLTTSLTLLPIAFMKNCSNWQQNMVT